MRSRWGFCGKSGRRGKELRSDCSGGDETGENAQGSVGHLHGRLTVRLVYKSGTCVQKQPILGASQRLDANSGSAFACEPGQCPKDPSLFSPVSSLLLLYLYWHFSGRARMKKKIGGNSLLN